MLSHKKMFKLLTSFVLCSAAAILSMAAPMPQVVVDPLLAVPPVAPAVIPPVVPPVVPCVGVCL